MPGHARAVDGWISATVEWLAKKGIFMTCLICDGQAAVVEPDGDYEERACPECGHYRVTGTALVLLKAHSWRFDLELTRKWIADHQSSGVIPTIDSAQAARLIDV